MVLWLKSFWHGNLLISRKNTTRVKNDNFYDEDIINFDQ